MEPRKQLLAALSALVVGMGTGVASARTRADDTALCKIANTALRAGDRHSLQIALGQFPSAEGKLSPRVRKCRQQLAVALVGLALPAIGPTPSSPSGHGGNNGGHNGYGG